MKPTTTEDVFDLMDAYVTSAALNAALELGLFWLLAEQPLEVPAVAQALGIPVNRCQYWLQFLSTTGLIERGPKGYAPSITAHIAILDACSQDTWAFLARDARERFPAIIDLALHMRQPGSTWAAQGLVPPDYFEYLVQDPERARGFTRMLYELHLPLAEALAEALDMGGVKRLMDLGGGSGVMSMALLRRYPDLHAVVVDIANVCAAGREIAAEASVAARLTYHVADFLHDELPSEFDMILMCDTGGFGEALLQKIGQALSPGGRLVIVYHLAPEPGLAPEPLPYPLWAFLASLESPDVNYPTMIQVRTRLDQAGFQLLSEAILPQKGTLRWTKGWMMIEARKE
jgi:SAM-dependent methyltransferase